MTLLEHKKLGKLIQECRSGDEQAFQKFYEHTAQVQYYQIRQMVKNSTDAMDALQETYLLLFKNIHNIKNPSTIVAYLNTLSYHVCQNHFRVTNRRERRISNLEAMEDIPSENADPQEVILQADKSNQIQEAILSLSEQERLVITMRYLQKMTLKETADALKLSYAKVRRLQQSAKENLKELLNLKGISALLPIFPNAAKELGHMIKEQISVPRFSSDRINQTGLSAPSAPCPSFTSFALKGAAAVAVPGVLICGSIAANSPAPEIISINVPASYAGRPAVVSVTSKSSLPIASCILKNDKASLSGEAGTGNQYSFEISRNGSYTLILKNTAGKTASKKIRIDCFDAIYPTAKSVRLKGKTFIVKFHDGESGIDEQSIYYDTSSGEKIYPKSFDRQTMTAVFRAVKGSHTLHFSDRSGNKSSALLKF